MARPEVIDVLIVLESPLLALGVRRTLDQAEQCRVIGELNDPEKVLPAVGRLHPGVVLLDSRFQSVDRPLVPRLTREHPDCKVLVMVDHTDQECTLRRLMSTSRGWRLSPESLDRLNECCLLALRSSARGCIPKSTTPRDLVTAVRAIAAGKYWTGPGLTAHLVDSVRQGLAASPTSARLSPRELEVIGLVVDGLLNKQIAARLGLSERTVKNHLARIMNKLDLHSRTELAIYAVRQRLA